VRRWLKEPLLHFVLLGAAIFAVDALRGGDTVPADEKNIVVSPGRVLNLAALFTKTWQRAPSEPELLALVEDYVLEEALYREGKALGVDQDDTIIRRRVRQKMEFVVDDIIEQAEPNEEQLEAWLANHLADYVEPARFRFRQIYLNPERHAQTLEADAEGVLAQLRALDEKADPRGLGDPALFEHAYPDASVEAITSIFGADFVEGLGGLPIGEWSGPLTSTFGLHIVHIESRKDSGTPALKNVRQTVARDWAYAQREEATKQYRDGILARYETEIQWPLEVQTP
jgi:hypothetical protein